MVFALFLIHLTESTFAILMILFAAGWSDRRGLRKPCMVSFGHTNYINILTKMFVLTLQLLPMLGELGATIGMFHINYNAFSFQIDYKFVVN